MKTGEIVAFLGPNGAGKTTTIKIIATLLAPTRGTVKIFGHDILTETQKVRQYIGICPQDLVFYENLTVYENLIFFGNMNNCIPNKLRKYANFLIQHVGLTKKQDTLAYKLSGGMKRRLNLIIGLIHDPDLIFLDEPTAGLDPQSRRLIWEFILNLKEKGKTIFLTTHYMDEADILADQVAIIDYGKIIAFDSPFDLKRQFSKGDMVEFKFQEPTEKVIKTLQLLTETQNLPDYEYIEEDNLYRINIHDGLIKIAEILKNIHASSLHISDMNINTNSLENVFLTLTGRSLRE